VLTFLFCAHLLVLCAVLTRHAREAPSLSAAGEADRSEEYSGDGSDDRFAVGFVVDVTALQSHLDRLRREGRRVPATPPAVSTGGRSSFHPRGEPAIADAV